MGLIGFEMALVFVAWIAFRNSEPSNAPAWRGRVARIALFGFVLQAVLFLLFEMSFWRTNLLNYSVSGYLAVFAWGCALGLLVLSVISFFAVSHWATKMFFAVCGLVVTFVWAAHAVMVMPVS